MLKLTTDIMEGFVKTFLHKGFDGVAEIPDCHQEWWELVTSDKQFVAIAAPRGHAKSTAITFSYALANICFRQRDYILIVSETEAQSILFLNDIKKELSENEELRTLFQFRGFIKDSETDFIGEFTDGTQFRVTAKGSEQRVRGLKWSSKRPNLIICDDLEGDEQVASKDRRDKFKRWFTGALMPCRSDSGIIRIVGTILHSDSLLENFMPKPHEKTTVQEGLKTYSTNNRAAWKAVKYKAHNEDFSLLLWESKKPRQELQKIKASYVEQGLADVYSREYLNEPLDEARAFFRNNDLIPLTEEDKNKRLNYYVGADFAISEKTYSDYTVFVVGGMDEDRIVHIKNVVRDRMSADEIINAILQIHKIYEPQLFVLEDGAILKTLLPALNSEMIRTGIFPNLFFKTPAGDKVSRARPLQARVKARAVRWDTDSSWWGDAQDELIKFPRARHDDIVDATSMLLLAVDKMVEAPTKEQQDQEDFEDEYASTYTSQQNGRSRITGY